MAFALEERRTSVASNFFLALGLARTPTCKQNRITTTQPCVATLSGNTPARAATGARAASTLLCFCSFAAWSRLLDISDMPKSCAEETKRRQLGTQTDRPKNLQKSAAKKGGNFLRWRERREMKGGKEAKKMGIYGLIRNPPRRGRETSVLTSRCLRFSRTRFLRCSS